jgi:hypothetical protein
LIPPATPGGNWRANVSLDNRLPLANAEFLLGNELDEIAVILHAQPGATSAEIAREMDNSLFRRGAAENPRITADDRATAGELFEIHSKRVQLERERDLLRARPSALSPAESERLAQVEREIPSHQQSQARLAGYMALDDEANAVLKVRLLREAAIERNRLERVPIASRQQVMEQWEEFLGNIQLGPATAILIAHGGAFGGGGIGPTTLTPQVVAHLMYPEPHAPVPGTNVNDFRRSGVSGGHLDSALTDFLHNHPEYGYYLHLEGNTSTNAGETYRRYAQYMWTGTGAPPAPGAVGHPSGSGSLDSGWVRSTVPKTTVTNFALFMEDSERALWLWVRNPVRMPTYFGPGATAGTHIEFMQEVPGGPRITGFFDFDPTRIAGERFRIRTAFIEASWIP